ncbi:GIY-YIG nuclease family protein [Granulicatella sp. zg-ZJ]|uniref:GIY-YIG nuclease family protein n=1 Tax=unclassified Granulicatella TaxID=2630493 RepID=UPI0013BF1AF4|nr:MULTISPECIES: GIY-YIG nuclease family protein [unclassified Granulicatella]MBS4750220.1 GIY-YIG nuclease family protein [Carnobacteriaceae bacterium zg-ZUI78]NEW63342.1 GIY-YIG nuclease family protein [Granulicatella sp. zg-ZJ]NEW65684.1 GIY-YIG nuclease family protein [Granulicatella sp. zg-84]QMI85676.1 GIY-YIG nuclease family protein [Carnobacteriaceae bacterium zg-84]
MESKNHYFYVLMCADNTFYAGYTTDVARRELEHNTSDKGAKYTKTRRPVKVIHVESFPTRSMATKQEAMFKKLSKKEKEAYIKHAHSKEF